MKNSQAQLFIVSAPSGAGKTSLVQQAIKDLRKLADSAPLHAPGQASQNIAKLSGAVVAALTSSHGPPAEFPIDFLRRCTLGFDDNTRLEGEGAFGKVPYHFLLYFLVLLYLL